MKFEITGQLTLEAFLTKVQHNMWNSLWYTWQVHLKKKKGLCKLGNTVDQYAWKLELPNKLQEEATYISNL